MFAETKLLITFMGPLLAILVGKYDGKIKTVPCELWPELARVNLTNLTASLFTCVVLTLSLYRTFFRRQVLQNKVIPQSTLILILSILILSIRNWFVNTTRLVPWHYELESIVPSVDWTNVTLWVWGWNLLHQTKNNEFGEDDGSILIDSKQEHNPFWVQQMKTYNCFHHPPVVTQWLSFRTWIGHTWPTNQMHQLKGLNDLAFLPCILFSLSIPLSPLQTIPLSVCQSDSSSSSN